MNFNLISPETTEDLLLIIFENQSNKFRFGAGYTDLILELKQQPDEAVTVINLANLKDERFTSVDKSADGIRIGALVTANRIISDKELQKQFPVLWKSAEQFASTQIRQVATIGGNICTASPAGDIACALMALEAECEILSARGTVRVTPIREFFVDVRKTDLRKDEVLRSIFIPSNGDGTKRYSDFIKIGTRLSMEIAVVSVAYHMQLDDYDKITHAGIAIGAVAPTIKFVEAACEYLVGKNFASIGFPESEKFAARVLEYASPISDIRASAWYRKEVLYNICKSIFEKQT